ncbi:MAG: hypothetical protein K2W82_16900 [Candidatus Obscuribacterales bacterium]|nr:hypothetical protein [Candidatus Obscuribacterales bacterium]
MTPVQTTRTQTNATFLFIRWLLSMIAGIAIGCFMVNCYQPEAKANLEFVIALCGAGLFFGWMILTACEVPQHCTLIWILSAAVGTTAVTFFLGGPYLVAMAQDFISRLFVFGLPMILGASMGLTSGLVNKLLTYRYDRAALTADGFPIWL